VRDAPARGWPATWRASARRRVDTSIVSTVEPAVTVALAVALFGEALWPLQVLGGALLLAAVVALQSRGSSSVRRRVPAAHAAAVAPARAPARDAA
jgi:drug/metabolite transporter (DMT)-like permease